ncbi:hypothetical protein AZO1586R_1428 [Bathymodiolus azoricus thioautotrophic gill symbiont]|uniref:Uncharacterized protein n=1 Tax=Bathymodiolus azoricus thioautotrophic gill symbiont TaxID=235205 RepID=A0ACA8ZRI6_9GAMM|nr:SpvB/TcaC N-terminal domain-containing protein [Bathymodiolus azoricus thioautotrophic gill symbiont]CAB5502423.1 hypothetical protein AZO1586R_1428 [Bathymodiolus azoricus thioautotrophic gill symbiont]
MKNLLKQSLNLTLPTLLVLLLGIPTQATASIDTSALVGSTAGSLSINQGAANYTIPITVPPGIAGMQPELSINYNSNTGNGQLGVGFSLGGSSIIHRCSKTIATDGTKGGVNYDSNDRYCIDGQRLIATAGTNGQASSEYHTEIEGFNKIKFTGNHWTVKTKSGQTFEYGNTDDSKIEAQGKSVVRFWAVNKITDAANNSINYVYNEDNDKGEYTLQRINYAGNSVRLTYEDRDDTHTSYQAGSKLQQTKRLSNITTYTNNDSLRDYDLSYQYYGTSEKSQLSSIEECVNGKCLPKTEFEWEESDVNNTSQDNWQRVEKYYPKKFIVNKDNKDQGVRLRDVNGDGLVDFIYSKGTDRKTYINTAQGWLENSSYKLNEPIVNDAFEDQGVRFLDVNGDGLLDYVRGEQLYKKVYLNTGSGWQLSSSFVLPQPIVSTYTYQKWFMKDIGGPHTTWWIEDSTDKVVYRKPSGMHFAELNGDGLIDIVYGRNNDKKAYLNNGSNWVESSNLAIPINITNSITETIGRKLPRFLGINRWA